MEPDRIEIYHDGIAAHHPLNHQNLSSVLALGGLLEIMKMVGGDMGVSLGTKLHPENFLEAEKTSLWASLQIRLSQDHISDDDRFLIAEIPRRYTYRGPMSTKTLLDSDKTWLRNEASHFDGCQFVLQDQISSNLKKVILDIEQESWKNSEMVYRTSHQIRLNPFQPHTDFGIPWASLHLPVILWPILWAVKHVPGLHILSTKLGAPLINKLVMDSQITHCGGVGWVAVEQNSPELIVRAGRLYLRIWLYLSHIGFALQPITIAPLGAFYQSHHPNHAYGTQRLQAALQKFRTEFDHLTNGKTGIPIWGFRAGRVAHPNLRQARSMRRPFEKHLLTNHDNIASPKN